MRYIEVSFRDIVEGRAYIRLNGEARVKLAHMAGAPWNDRIPDAKLHDMQQEVLKREERTKLVHGASRLGKSVLGGCEGICEAMIPGSKLAVVAQRYEHVGAEWQYIYRGLRKLFEGHPQAFKRLAFKSQAAYHVYEFETIWGSRGQGFSVESDEGASLLGREFSRVILGEGSHISQEILEKRILRAIDGWLIQDQSRAFRRGGYLSIYTTPRGYAGCSAALWEAVTKRGNPEDFHVGKVPWPETVWLRAADILENPYYSREVYEARRKTMDPKAFAEQYQGKMVFRTGMVFREFEEARHVVPTPPPEAIRSMRLGVGFDTGAYTGVVLVGIDPDRRKWVLGETYTVQRTLRDTLSEFRRMLVEVLGPAFQVSLPREEAPEAWEEAFEELKDQVDVWVVDPASQHKLEIIEELGVSLSDPHGLEGGKLQLFPSIDLVNDWFAADKAFIAETCDVLVDQIRKYVWKHRKAPTRGASTPPVVVEPRKEYDHLIDAMRFVWVMLEFLGPRPRPARAISTAEAAELARRERIFGPLKDILGRAEQMGGIWS